VDISIFDQYGLDINKTTERKIENLFFREDYRRVYLDDIGVIEVLSNADIIGRYLEGFNKVVNHQVVRKRKFQLVVDYAHGTAAQMLPDIFSYLGCEVIVLNTSSNDGLVSRSLDEQGKDM